MSLQLEGDPDRVGFALLRLKPQRTGPLAVSIQFLDQTYLGPDGRRTRERHLFEAEPHAVSDMYRLGPSVTALVPAAEIVTLADAAGVKLGTVAWDDIRPPPEAGRGALIGSIRGAQAKVGPKGGALAGQPALSLLPMPEPAPEPATPDRLDAALTQPPPRSGRTLNAAAALVLCVAIVSGLVLAGLVLSGRIGWVVEGPDIRFVVAADGAATPSGAEARLRPLWFARPFARFVSEPFAIANSPRWLALRQNVNPQGYDLQTSVASSVPALRPGDDRYRVRVRFPLGGTGAGLGVNVAVSVAAPLPPPPLKPVAPAPSMPPSPVDDAACDRVAGSRFDPDHPTDGAFVDDSFETAAALLDAGIAACDRRTDRTGPDRRFLVQRGRLLAARALLRVAAGDFADARREMDEAVAAWRIGSDHGSALADSLLGAYAFGSYNRPALTFVQPDDAAAVTSWAQGMGRGSIVAQRNYATQLMAGRGIAADPGRALGLLRDALGRGDERAAGPLGVALYTGYPPGVPLDKAQGWPLVVRAQCLDKSAAVLLGAEIARGAKPASDRKPCP